jgi:hypothetical protein
MNLHWSKRARVEVSGGRFGVSGVYRDPEPDRRDKPDQLAREAAYRQVFDSLEAKVLAALEGSEFGVGIISRHKLLTPKLEAAEAELAKLHRDRQRLALDREDALHRLDGEKLAAKLSALAEADEALKARIEATRLGMDALRLEADEARVAAENAVESAVASVLAEARRETQERIDRREHEVADALAVLLEALLADRYSLLATKDESRANGAAKSILKGLLG